MTDTPARLIDQLELPQPPDARPVRLGRILAVLELLLDDALERRLVQSILDLRRVGGLAAGLELDRHFDSFCDLWSLICCGWVGFEPTNRLSGLAGAGRQATACPINRSGTIHMKRGLGSIAGLPRCTF